MSRTLRKLRPGNKNWAVQRDKLRKHKETRGERPEAELHNKFRETVVSCAPRYLTCPQLAVPADYATRWVGGPTAVRRRV